MPCYHPLRAWRTLGGAVVFAERGNIERELSVACGRCIGCRLERSRQWAIRCMHESQLHEVNSFLTLTYDDKHLESWSLDYADFQGFMKRLRARVGPVRFFMAGEYGESTWRPHFHACLFGFRPTDLVVHSQLPNGGYLYSSKKLDAVWKKGFVSVGDVTFESAAYVARYVTKKVTGAGAVEHYTRVDPRTGEVVVLEPEFCSMSLKPGIGAKWYEKYKAEVDVRDAVVIRGRECKPPRYYDRLRLRGPVLDVVDFEFDLFERGKDIPVGEDSVSRLRAREKVAKARLSFRKRSL